MAEHDQEQIVEIAALKRALLETDSLDELQARIMALSPTLVGAFRPSTFNGIPSALITLARPIEAMRFSRAMEWSYPYACSFVVHQDSWTIVLRTGEFKDPHGHTIIRADRTEIGRWAVHTYIDRRPRGELPGIYCGPSPAYDIARYPASVVALEARLMLEPAESP